MKEDKVEVKLNQEEVQAIIDCYEKDLKYIKKLEKENQQLHNKIDKAIEYIEENAIDENGDIGINFYANNTYELLEILKDSDVDE